MGSLLKDLKEGDIVVISRSSSYYDRSDSNPTDDIKGAVTKVNKYSAMVKWNNGKSNGYRDHDLVKISETAPISSELTKTPIIGKWYTNPYWSRGSLAKFRKLEYGDAFGYSESTCGSDVSRVDSSWSMGNGVRLATESELRTLPKSHPDHPDKSSSSDKRGTPIGSYTPKKGDKVKVVANRGESGVSIGDIGIVDHLKSDHCSIKVDSRTYYNYFDDLELISTEKITSTLRGVPIGEYTPKTGDKVRIVANRSGSSNKIGDIGIVGNDYSTNCVVDVDGRSRGGNSHYYDDLEFISSKATTSSIWRIKTQREMIEDGTIPSGCTRPFTWESQMDKYFGEIIPSKFYPDIERMGDRSIDLWEGYCYNKSHLTTKSMPWDTSVVKHFVDSDDDEESEYDDTDEDDPDDIVSWFDSSEEEALDKLDKMSKGEAKEVWFEKSEVSFWDDYTPPTKRPKLEVEVIPHKSRKIF